MWVGHGIYQSAQAMLTRAMEGESTAFDRLVPGANGVRRWMTIRVVPDAAPSGEVYGAFVLMNDIHGLKQAQEALRASEAELRLIMDNVPARVSYIDRDYKYLFLNRHNEDWLGGEPQGTDGRQIAEVNGEERTGSCSRSSRECSRARRSPRNSSSYSPVASSAGNRCTWRQPRCRGQRHRHLRRAHDIHDQKRNQEAVKRANWMLSVAHQQHAAGGSGVGSRL
jgi:PAS domain-containing protein